MKTNVRIGLCALVGFLLTFLLWLSDLGVNVTGIFALLFSAAIAAVTFFITKLYEKVEFESSTIVKQIDGATVILLYILSFFIPLAGFIVGAIYASKNEEHYKHVGKNCLIFSVMNIVIGFIMVVAILGSM